MNPVPKKPTLAQVLDKRGNVYDERTGGTANQKARPHTDNNPTDFSSSGVRVPFTAWGTAGNIAKSAAGLIDKIPVPKALKALPKEAATNFIRQQLQINQEMKYLMPGTAAKDHMDVPHLSPYHAPGNGESFEQYKHRMQAYGGV